VASHLCQQGLIVYRRGFIEIVDRVGLEGASCECYGFIRDEFARLVGPPVQRAQGHASRNSASAGVTSGRTSVSE
jgi:hypothetical protein